VEPKAGLKDLEKRSSSLPQRKSNQRPPSPWSGHYTDYAVRGTNVKNECVRRFRKLETGGLGSQWPVATMNTTGENKTLSLIPSCAFVAATSTCLEL